ncbi:MAG: hypothetical protein J6X71_05875 [Bacteroidales bacterium]|nr:hypothetical protein [Bacteroidales bacterium]
MKKLFYILAVASLAFVSCNKNVIDTPVDNPATTGKTITFSASIDMPAATKASLDGLDIKWSSGDYIGICTDNDATIVAYPVTVDGSDATICTITVNEVAGASEYYGIFRGSLGASGDTSKEIAADDFSGITFDTATKTFSGLTVGNQQVASGSLSSYLWYTHGFPLSMAGKSSGTSLVMRPCLALFQVSIAAGSVPDAYYLNTETYTSSKGIDHDHTYSAVRGFNLYQKGSSTIYSSGDYTVQVAADGTLTTVSVANGSQKEYRQISQSAKLTAGTNYIMCLIPGGSVSSFKFDFLGYSDNTGGLSWDAVYTMNLKKPATVKPGDFYDFGTLNPLSLKKAKNEADDEAADAAAASYVPAITIDGDLSDWAGISASFTDDSKTRIREWRIKSDEQYVYFYIKFRKNRVDSGRTLCIIFDTDNDSATGYSGHGLSGGDQRVTSVPFTNVGEGTQPVCVNGFDPNGAVNGSSDSGAIMAWAYDDGSSLSSSSSNIYLEISIPRSKLTLPTTPFTVSCSYDYYTTAYVSGITLE